MWKVQTEREFICQLIVVDSERCSFRQTHFHVRFDDLTCELSFSFYFQICWTLSSTITIFQCNWHFLFVRWMCICENVFDLREMFISVLFWAKQINLWNCAKITIFVAKWQMKRKPLRETFELRHFRYSRQSNAYLWYEVIILSSLNNQPNESWVIKLLLVEFHIEPYETRVNRRSHTSYAYLSCNYRLFYCTFACAQHIHCTIPFYFFHFKQKKSDETIQRHRLHLRKMC